MPIETIAAYVTALSAELRYDRALARRVCAEVEDHLLQAARDHGERAAIERFGVLAKIARDFAATSYHRQLHSAVLAAGTLVILAFSVMEARWVLYGALHLRVAPTLLALIDRDAFLAGGLFTGFALIAASVWRPLRTSFALTGACCICVLSIVAVDLWATILRTTALHGAAVGPALLACTLEGALGIALVARLRGIAEARRRASA